MQMPDPCPIGECSIVPVGDVDDPESYCWRCPECGREVEWLYGFELLAEQVAAGACP